MSSELTTIESLFLSYRDGTKKPYDVVRKYLEKIEEYHLGINKFKMILGLKSKIITKQGKK